MSELERLEHLVFGQFDGPAFDHGNGFFGARHDDVQGAFIHFVHAGVDDQLAVYERDPDGADGAVERDARDAEGRGHTVHRHDIRVIDAVGRKYGREHLGLVLEPLREQGPDRTVGHPAYECFTLARPGFPAEKVARDAAGGGALFAVLDGHREKIFARPGFRLYTNCGEYGGIALGDEYGAVGLFCNAAGLESQVLRTDSY